MSLSGLPAGATGSFNPVSVSSSGSSALTVSTGCSTPAGTYTLTITGTSTSGLNRSRVFEINSGVRAFISGLTIAGGNANPFASTPSNPKPGNQGGDIYNGGILTLTNDIVRGGLASGGGADGDSAGAELHGGGGCSQGASAEL